MGEARENKGEAKDKEKTDFVVARFDCVSKQTQQSWGGILLI